MNSPQSSLSHLRGDFERYNTVNEGDCFFDSVAQLLRIMKSDMNITVKSLRNVCKHYAQTQLQDKESWLRILLENELENIDKYILCIEFSVEDFKDNPNIQMTLKINSPIWGRSEIEGRIICIIYNIKICEIDRQYIAQNERVVASRIIDRFGIIDGFKLLDTLIIYDEENTIFLINKGFLLYQPLFQNHLLKFHNLKYESEIDKQNEDLLSGPEYNERKIYIRKSEDINCDSQKRLKLKINNILPNNKDEENNFSREDINSSEATNSQNLIDTHYFTNTKPNYAFTQNYPIYNQHDQSFFKIKKLSHLIRDKIKINLEKTITNSVYKDIPLIALACKYNIFEILQYLCKNVDYPHSTTSSICKKLGNRNCFYYAILSSNTEIFQLLVEFWNSAFTGPNIFKELDDLISNAYEDIKLENVPISLKMEEYVQEILINCRFSYVEDLKSYDLSQKNIKIEIKKRIDMINEYLCVLLNEYSTDNQILDKKFLYICTLIAKNLHILKRQLKNTYDKIPWEEMEFYLVAYVSSHTKHEEINWIYNTILDKKKLLFYLNEFVNELKNTQTINENKNLKNCEREQLIKSITAHNKNFESLIDDFIQIKNVYSLYRIKYYVDLALCKQCITADVNLDYLVIKRALQVTGEYLKNTVDSPHLSPDISKKIFASFRLNVRKIISKLRDKLSHFHTDENEYITKYEIDIRNDLSKLKRTINSVFYDIQTEKIQEILEKVLQSTDMENITKLSGLLRNFKINPLDLKPTYMKEIDKIKELVEELKIRIKNPTIYEQHLFYKIENKSAEEMQQHNEINIRNIGKIIILSTAIKLNLNIELIKKYAEFILKGRVMSKTQKKLIEEISELICTLCYSFKARTGDNSLTDLQYQMYINAFFKLSNVKSIQTFTSEFEINFDEEYLKESILEIANIVDKHFNNNLLIRIIKSYEELENFINGLRNVENVFDLNKYKSLWEFFTFKLEHVKKFEKYINNSQWNELANGLQFYLKNYREFKKSVKIFQKDRDFKIVAKSIKKLCEFISDALKEKLDECLNEISKDENKKLEKYFLKIMEMLEKVVLYFEIPDEKFQNNFNKLIAVYETLLLDIFAYLEEKKGNLSLNKYGSQFFVDKMIPTLIGKSLRNYLAHGSPLIDSLELKPYVAVITNCKKVIEKKFELLNDNSYFAIDQPPLAVDYLKLQYQNRLQKLSNQRDMFDAVEKNDLKAIKYYKNRIDEIYARDINNSNVLHYAAKNDCLDSFKLLLNENLINGEDVNGAKPLHIASKEGSLRILTFCLQNNIINVNDYYDSKGFSLFNYAKDNRQIEIFELLLKYCNHNGNLQSFSEYQTDISCDTSVESGFYVSTLIKTLRTQHFKKFVTLHTATRMRHMSMIVNLIKMGANINEQDNIGNTPLHIAAKNNFTEIIDFFLSIEGINMNLRNTSDFTPLHVAIFCFNKEAVECLLKAPSLDVNYISSNCISPLVLAISLERKDILEILLKVKDINFDIKEFIGFSPLHLAARFSQKDIIQMLLEYKEHNVNCKSNDGDTPLHVASYFGHKHVVEILLNQKGININCRDNGNHTPLYYAVQEGHKDIVVMLLNREDIDINCRDFQNITPLHLATKNEFGDIVEILLNEKEIDGSCKTSFNYTTLHYASENGNKNILEILLKQNHLYINYKDSQNYTPLHLASEHGNLDIVQMLLAQKDVDVNCRTNSELTPLHLASQRGHKNIVEILLCKEDINVNSRGSADFTSLHLASQNGHSDIVKLLLKKKEIEVNCKNSELGTPLYLAVQGGHKDVVETLLTYKDLDINSTSITSFTPLHLASRHGLTDIVELLIKNENLDVNYKTSQNETPLHLAAFHGFTDVVELLIKNKRIDFNCKSGIIEFTPLHLASQRGHTNIVEILLKHKEVQVNCNTFTNSTPLHLAAENGHKKIVELLLEHKDVNVNSKTKRKFTALHLAAQKGYKDVVETLLKANGIDIICEQMENLTPLHIASESGHKNVVELILKQKEVNVNCQDNEKFTPLHSAAYYGHKDVVKILLEQKGVNVNIKDITELTPLHISSQNGHIDVVELLIEHQNIDVNLKSNIGDTPLHIAVMQAQKKIVETLLKCNSIDVNAINYDNVTALHLAAEFGHIDIVRLLLQHKNMDINCKDIEEVTPLYMATQEGYNSIVEMMLQHENIDVNCKTDDNSTPLHIAVEKGHNSIIQILLNHVNINVNCEDKEKYTPLHLAAQEGNKHIVEMLLLHKTIDINCRADQNLTPLHLAAYNGHKQIVEILLVQKNLDANAILDD